MSAINPQNIFRSAHFIDNSHYDEIFSIFKQNIHKDLQNVTRLLSRCATEDEKLDVLGKYFNWRKIPKKYFDRIKKSSQFSNSFRILGNESYKEKKISEALRFYNLAILFAHAKSPEKGLALANRSALLMGVKEYEDALTDCMKALDYADVLGDSEIVDKLKIRKAKLDTLSKNGTNLHDKHFTGTEMLREIVEKVGKNNDEIDGAAEFVRIFTQEGKGRGLKNVGLEEVKAGKCILVDAGYTIMLDKQTNWETDHCSGCGKVILGGVSDGEDVFSSYCSSTCMETFTKTYGNLPTLYPYFHHIEPLHECLLICKIFAKSREHDLNQSVTKSKYDCRSYSTVANLMAHSVPFDPTRITSESPHFKAIFIGHLLKNVKFLKLPQSTISWLTLRHLFSLPHNMITLSDWMSPEGPITHPLWDSRAREKYLKIKTKSYATGVFPVTALCNHSCDPNCVWVQNPRVGLGVLVAIREIGVGEEFCICYKQPWSRMRGDERRKWLREGYGFECRCVACIEDWKMMKDGEDNVDKMREFETLLKNGECLLNSGNVRQAWKCFMEIEVMIREEDRRLEWVQRGEEFGRRTFVEMGMR